MRKHFKFLIPALLVVALIVSCAVIFASAEDKVVYVSSTGTAPDGVTLPDGAVIVGPGTVTGDFTDGTNVVLSLTDEPYYEAIAKIKALNKAKVVSTGDTLVKASPLYKAIAAVGSGNTGTIILLDEIAIGVADRMENGSAAEHKLPSVGHVTVTTKDAVNGVDYAEKGAKLILDHSSWNSINMQLSGKMTLKDIDVEYRYNSSKAFGSWEGSFNIFTSANQFTVDEGVTVTSFDYKTGTPVEGTIYPNIFGGVRYGKLTNGTSYITIKSGKWGKIFGAGHGMSSSNTAEIKAATIVVEGGEVAEIRGAGSSISNRAYAFVANDLTINVTGGKVGTITTETAKGIAGAISVKVFKPAEVEKLVAADNVSKSKTPTSVAVEYDEVAVTEVTGFEASELTKYENVIYVSANGTGDGKTPETPMGNGLVTTTILNNGAEFKKYTDAKYEDVLAEMKAAFGSGVVYTGTDALVSANALYRAVKSFGDENGTIVLVGPTNIDVADRMQNDSPAEFKLPKSKGTITITSVYGGKDYSKAENGGAKLVLDRSVYNSINLEIHSKMVWENMVVEHSQAKGNTTASRWPANFMVFMNGYDFTIGDNVKTTSWDAANNKTGGSYTYLFAGKRYGKVTVADTDGQDIVIKSGLWQGVYTAGVGMNATNNGTLTGNVKVTLSETNSGSGYETNIVQFNAGGFTARSVAGTVGDVTLNVEKGARIQNYIYAQSAGGVTGKVVMNIAKDADIRSNFKGVYYTDGSAHTSAPAGVELNFYTTTISEDKIFNVADFEATGNVYNPIDKTVTPPPAGGEGGTPAVSGDQVVIYIASEAKGTGDGSSPENAMGNDAGYANTLANGTAAEKKELVAKNAFNKALLANSQAIVNNGGVIVIVDDFAFDTADGYRDSFSEYRWKANTGSKNITITSFYNGVDYRASGAELIFDTSKIGMNVEFKAPITLEYLNIESRIDSSRSYGKTDEGVAAISTHGLKFVVDEEVVVTCNDVRASGTKVTKYPSIFGYARLGAKAPASTSANPDITINSGNWGKVFGSSYGAVVSGTTPYGSLTGNISVTVNGGSIDQLCGTSRFDLTTVTAIVTGDVTLNVNGGTVANIYGSNHNGINGKITVNVSENAKITGKAYSYALLADNSNEANKPADATINYNRKAIADENVLYWTAANGTGEATGGGTTPPTPPPAPTVPTVVYIAANGTGDGSSADKPLGNVANYDNQNYADNLFYRAVQMLENGGTIVVVGDVALDTAESRVPTAEGQKQSPSEFKIPAAGGEIVVTSVYGGTDYRANAKFIIDADKCNSAVITLNSAFTFENLNIEYKYDPNDINGWGTNVAFAAFGYKLVMGEGLNVTSLNADTNKAGDQYPTIYGGHRYNAFTRDADVTIKSGKWGLVIAGSHGMTAASGHGKITGNVTLNVMGGEIETIYGTSSSYRPTGIVTGTTTINVTGGKVGELYGATTNGAEGPIVVTIAKTAERVNKAWAYLGTGTAPTNASITYDRSVIRDDEVMYWTNTDAQGKIEDQPTVVIPEVVIYIAAEAKGTGDGSSPENAMGHDADYADILANGTTDQKKKLNEKHAFNKALLANNKEIIKNGGTIVIVDEIAFESADGYRESYSEFRWMGGTGTKNITITSVYGGVDYREQGAKLVLDTSKVGMVIEIKAPTTWEYLDIESRINSSRGYGKSDDGVAAFALNGYKFVVGEGVEVKSVDTRTSGTKVEKYPTIFGYARLGAKAPAVNTTNTDITINSGTWGKIYGANYGGLVSGKDQYGSLTGNVTITVNGGKISQLCGTSRIDYTAVEAVVTGNVTITVNGGTIANLYGTNHAGINGKITVDVSENAKITGKAYAYSALDDGINADKKPTDATINYNRKAIADERVLYWTTANGTGEAVPEDVVSDSVIYVSANGTGDGSTPDKPLGNVANYNNQNYADNLFYRAIELLPEGGTIVLVGDVSLDTAESRVPTAEGKKESPSEFKLPAAQGPIVVTSVIGGKDYRANAKLIIDADKCNSAYITMQSAFTFENLNIEYKYDPNDPNGWGTNVTIAANGYKLVMGDGLNVTSLNADTNNEGDQFADILGGHRYSPVKRNTNVTIKSGKWGTVIAGSHGMSASNPGKVTGNATLNVEGGQIDTIYGTSSLIRPTGEVTGTTTINVTGGRVGAIYGASTNGAKGDIIVTIAETAERVVKAWGHPGSSTKYAPDNAVLTYDRSVIRDDEVAYWTNTVINGSLADQPEKEYYTVYVADVAKGKGDGSSPENAIGATEDYNAQYNRMLELLAIPSKDRTEAQVEEFNSYKLLYQDSAIFRAMTMTKLGTQGGKLVLVGPTTINTTDSLAANTSNGDFQFGSKASASQIIITSVDKGVDYREQGAKLVIDRTGVGVSLTMKTPTLWEKLDIEYKYNSAKSTSVGSHTLICLNGNEGIFGEDITVTPNDINTTKSRFYPNIVGANRFADKAYDTSIVIESGRWGAVVGGNYGRTAEKKDAEGNVIKDENGKTVYDSFGFLTGNVNIVVSGGKVTQIIGTCRDDSSSCVATVKGNVNIDIKGNAEVVKLYAANRNGIEGKITVNVTEDAYVGTAWGYHFTTATEDKQPTDATLSYVRTAIAEADVKYWTTVNASGEGEPGVHGPVIYVATVARGTGDGSSPENAMGNDPSYAADFKKAQKLMGSVESMSQLSKENQTFVGSVYKKLALYRALSQDNNAIIDEGGTIVVVDRLVINAADGFRRSLSEFRWPAAGSKTIRITSKYDGVDYRAKGARVVLDVTDVGLCVETKSPTIWDNLVFEHRYNSKNGTSVDSGALIAAAGNKIVIGYNVKTIANDTNPDEEKRKEIYPSLCGGGRYSDFKTPTHVTINGGTWAMVVGGAWSGTNTGSTTIGIGGGKITTVCGTSKPTSGNSKHIVQGSVWIGLWGGEVGNVYGTGKAGLKWGSVGVGIGKNCKIKGKIYATHPDYKGKDITAIAYFNEGVIKKNKLVGFTVVNPQTGSSIIYLSAAAVVGLVSTGIVVSKKRKKIED